MTHPAIIDSRLAQLRADLEKLQAEKIQRDAHKNKLDNLVSELEKLCAAESVKVEDLFSHMERRIERWIKTQREQEEGIHQHLKSYYARVISEGPRKEAKVKEKRPSINIPTGTYFNPYTLETLTKTTRTPTKLGEWIAVYGLGTVETWRR